MTKASERLLEIHVVVDLHADYENWRTIGSDALLSLAAKIETVRPDFQKEWAIHEKSIHCSYEPRMRDA